MTTRYFNPSNPLAARWASAVEQYLRQKYPDQTISQIRSNPMMVATYQQLKSLAEGKLLDRPADDAALNEKLAYSSQQYLMLATTTVPFVTTFGIDYNTFKSRLTDYNNANNIVSFSTEDTFGFALTLVMFLGIFGNSVQSGALEVLLDLLKDHATDYLTQEQYDELLHITHQVHAVSQADHLSCAYRSATDNPNYGTLGWRIPNDAQIIMLGDWGTGMDDAVAFLQALWDHAFSTHPEKYIVFMHLGDIYYSGLPVECEDYFFNVFQTVGANLAAKYPNGKNGHAFNSNPPIFTIPGNHEYYCGGYGYFQLLDRLNQNVTYPTSSGSTSGSMQQTCSFFNLKTENGKWQFMGMDTGQDDYNALESLLQAIGSIVKGWLEAKIPSWLDWTADLAMNAYQNVVGPFEPQLRNDEVSWLTSRISNFSGKTILLSHHQLFSSEAEIDHEAPQYINKSLRKKFQPYFGKIAAWYWGHEHTYAMYLDGLQGLNKGRLLGSSAYEATDEADTPYTVNYPAVPKNSHMGTVSKDATSGLYNHAGAILYIGVDDATGSTNADKISVKYWQFPAWGQNPNQHIPQNPTLSTITSESISDSNFASLQPYWLGNVKVKDNSSTPQTPNSPTLDCWDNVLYMAYQESNNKDRIGWAKADISNFHPTSKTDKITWTIMPELAYSVNGNTNHPNTEHSLASVMVNGVWYVFFIDKNNHNYITYMTYNIATNTWNNPSVTNNSGVASNQPVAACFFQGLIYIVYRPTSSSNNLNWLSYDITHNRWTDLGAMKDSGNNQFESDLRPALAATPGKMVMVYATVNNNDNIAWAVYSQPASATPYQNTGAFSWENKGDISTLSGDHQMTPDTDYGLALTNINGGLIMARIDENTNLKTSILLMDTETWYGNLEVDTSSGTMQTEHAPAMVGNNGLVHMVRCDLDSSDEYLYWLYA